MPPAVYLDECVDHHLVVRLRQRGFTATSALAQQMIGASDEEQLNYAAQRNWAILTHNKRHFQRWHRRFQELGRTHSGILVLPPSPLLRLELRTAMLLDWIDTRPVEPSPVWLWHDLQVWLNQGNNLPGYRDSEIRFAIGR
jgi:hypothetical protein